MSWTQGEDGKDVKAAFNFGLPDQILCQTTRVRGRVKVTLAID